MHPLAAFKVIDFGYENFNWKEKSPFSFNGGTGLRFQSEKWSWWIIYKQLFTGFYKKAVPWNLKNW